MAGTVAIEHKAFGAVRRVRCTCVADAADASIPDTVLPRIEGRLIAIETNPGATAPTDNYDVSVTDAEGHDVLEGVGANRDTATTEKAPIVYTGTALHPVVSLDDVLTLKVANNLVNSAQVVISLYYSPGV